MKILRTLKILSYVIWLVTSALFLLVVYNLSNLRLDSHHEQKDNTMIFTVSAEHRGYIFDFKVNITVLLFDETGNLVTKNGTILILRPGEMKNQSFTLRVDTGGQIYRAIAFIKVAQVVSGFEVIAIATKTAPT